MTKYNSGAQQRVVRRPDQPHPIWRGIGCVIMIIVPLMSFALAVITVEIGVAQNWPIPYQLLGNPVMPAVLWNNAYLPPVLGFIQSQTNLYAVLAITIFYIIVIGAFVAVGYAILYRFVGPPRYSPIDAPPPSRKVKAYKR